MSYEASLASGCPSEEGAPGGSPAQAALSEFSDDDPHHPNFYIDDDTCIVLKADATLYKVHRYLLMRESVFFADMFQLPADTSGSVEGSSDEHPIVLSGTPPKELDVLFTFLYFGMHDDMVPSTEGWIDILSIADRLLFDKIRARAVKEITARLDEIEPFRVIELSHTYNVDAWLHSASVRIASRGPLLEYGELVRVPFNVVVMLTRAHERYQVQTQWGQRGAYYTNSPADHIVTEEIQKMKHTGVHVGA